MVRIIMRNHGNGREDAVYILDIPPTLDGNYFLTAYWGRWATFQRSKFAQLRWQSKYRGGNKVALMEVVQRICSEKLGKGYEVQEKLSILPKWPILPYGQNWRDHSKMLQIRQKSVV